MKDQLSQLMDGELDEDSAGRLLASLKTDRDLTDEWHMYHLIGDSLRNDAPLSSDFSTRFSARLAAEPIVFSPKSVLRRNGGFSRRTIALSAAASVTALAMVSWFAFSGSRHVLNPQSVQPMMAVNDSALRPVSVSDSDDGMQDYLVAHHEYAGLQTVALSNSRAQKGH